MEEIKLNMENLTKEEREQLLKLIEKVIEKANKQGNKIWKPEDGDIYYFINSYGDIYHSTCEHYATSPAFCSDGSRYALGNCFKTKEEAEFALERQKVIIELERFAKEHNELNTEDIRFYLAYDSKKDLLVFRHEDICYYGGSIFFDSELTLNKAIQTIGKNRLKKYYFGIKER